MNQLLNVRRLAVLGGVALVLNLCSVSAVQAAPPNWKVTASGTATLDSITVVGGVPFRTDIDAFGGHSSHLGKFTGTGSHVLNLVTGEFAGFATYRAANGDKLRIVYAGHLFPSGDADFPYGAVADVEIVGGTGRFARASGGGILTGGFTGAVPVGDIFFDIEGTLRTK